VRVSPLQIVACRCGLLRFDNMNPVDRELTMPRSPAAEAARVAGLFRKLAQRHVLCVRRAAEKRRSQLGAGNGWRFRETIRDNTTLILLRRTRTASAETRVRRHLDRPLPKRVGYKIILHDEILQNLIETEGGARLIASAFCLGTAATEYKLHPECSRKGRIPCRLGILTVRSCRYLALPQAYVWP
jgi:hypothetical protein